MYRRIHNVNVLSGALLLGVLIVACGKSPTDSEVTVSSGRLAVRAQVAATALAKTAGVMETAADSLIVEVSASDMKTVRSSLVIENGTPVLIDTLSGIPAGNDRVVTIWTVDKNGAVLHRDSAGSHTVQILPNATAQIFAKLKATAGSIYLQIANVPDTVDSVVAVFTSSDGSGVWSTKVKRSVKVFIAIDNIPDSTRGILKVSGVDSLNDTVYQASTELLFSIANPSVVNLEFHTLPGLIDLGITIEQAPATLVSSNMGAYSGDRVESGELLISEIMYASNDSEYVEIFNPGATPVVFDTLLIDVDGVCKSVANVTVQSMGYYTIGRRALPWTLVAMSPVSFLDLSQNGNWITLRNKNKQMIDRVAFVGITNALEWPNVTGKKSIILNSGALSASANNIGRNWSEATVLISGSTTQFGTPGF